MIVLLLILGVAATGLSIWLVALTSPLGYENETGFYLGEEPQIRLQKVRRKTSSSARIPSKNNRRKSIPKNKSALPQWQTPNPYADQMKFPFPAPQ